MAGAVLAVFVAGHDSFLVCCSAQTGQPLWERPAGFTANSPTASADLVFVSNFDGVVFAFGLDGTLVWEVKLPSRLAGPPVLADHAHLVVATDSHIVCLRPLDGTTVWSRDAGGRSYRIDASNGVVVQSVSLPSGRALRSLSLADGRPRWSNKPLPWLSDPCAMGDVVFAATGDEVHAYSLASGSLLIRYRLSAKSRSGETPQPQHFLPDPSGRLYFGTILGGLHALTHALEPLWHLDFGIHQMRLAPWCALSGDSLACLTTAGVLHLLDPATGAELSRTDLRSRPDEGGLAATPGSLVIAHAATLRRLPLQA